MIERCAPQPAAFHWSICGVKMNHFLSQTDLKTSKISRPPSAALFLFCSSKLWSSEPIWSDQQQLSAAGVVFNFVCYSWLIFSAKINHLPHTDQYFLGRGRKNKKKYSYFVLFILFCGALNNLKWSEAIEFSASAPQVIFWFLCSFWTIDSAKINHFLPKLTS